MIGWWEVRRETQGERRRVGEWRVGEWRGWEYGCKWVRKGEREGGEGKGGEEEGRIEEEESREG